MTFNPAAVELLEQAAALLVPNREDKRQAIALQSVLAAIYWLHPPPADFAP